MTLTVTEGVDGTRESGERKVVVTFDVELTGDGTTASLKTVENGQATISIMAIIPQIPRR